MFVGSQKQLKAYDQYLLNLGYSMNELVDKASDCLLPYFSDYKKVSLLIGPGNNGADALSLGIKLKHMNIDIVGYYIGDSSRFSEANQYYFDEALKNNIALIELNEETYQEFKDTINDYEVIADGFFGFGLNSAPRGMYATVIDYINSSYMHDVIAIDIPTGLDCNKGTPYASTLYASKTIALTALKEGYLNPDSTTFTGEVIVEELETEDVFMEAGLFEMVDHGYAIKHLKERKYDGYKNYYGVDLIIAGSQQYKGAPLMAIKAAVNTGAGIVHVSTSKEVANIMPLYLPEAISTVRPNEYEEDYLAKFNAILLGPGIGLDIDAYRMVVDVINKSECPLVLDADALTILSNNIELLDRQKRDVILTPHLGEFKRLADFELSGDLMDDAVEFARRHHCILVLKGPHTIVTNGHESYRMNSGNKAMAVGGMGDTLAGIITAMVGQKYDVMTAVILAVYIHGYTGDMLAKKRYTVLPDKLAEAIPQAMFTLINNVKVI